MNLHRNRNKPAKKTPECLAVEAFDHMPVEVANAMLLTPGTSLTNRMRKNCMDARTERLVSTREPKDYIQRLEAKAKRASAAQLLKWARRTVVERARVTRAYLTLARKRASLDPMALHEIAKCNRVMMTCDVEATRLDLQMGSYRGEAERRLLENDVFNPVRD